MAQPRARSKKKPRTKARPLKKATQHDQRVKRARAKTVLAVTAALVRGMLNETERCLAFDHEKHKQQAEKVKRWADECINLKDMELGRRSLDEAFAKTHSVHKRLNSYISERGPHGIGHYAIAWVALGYFVDEARWRYVQTPEIKRRWNFFASTVNTFAEMFLDEAEQDRDYEALAGEAAEQVWGQVFEMPEGSWIKL